MNAKNRTTDRRNRFNKLSLKKNRLLSEETKKLNRSSDVIILDESFDKLRSEFHKNLNPEKLYSPIVIDDSCELYDDDLPKITVTDEPSKAGNVSFNCSKDSLEPQITCPSNVGWSPAQNIIKATPRHDTIPTTPKDKMNESFEQCSLKKIQESQRKLLTDLYGDTWKSIPKLIKSITKNQNNFNGISKKLQFDDEEKENIRSDIKLTKELYLTNSDVKRNETKFGDTTKKSKKKLYTEKVLSTPEVPKLKTDRKPRNANSTTKKAKINKAMSVTEMVEVMKENILTEKNENIPNLLKNLENNYSLTKKNEDISSLTKKKETVDNSTERNISNMAKWNDNIHSLTNNNENAPSLTKNNRIIGNSSEINLTRKKDISSLTKNNENIHSLTKKNEDSWSLTKKNRTTDNSKEGKVPNLTKKNENTTSLTKKNDFIESLTKRVQQVTVTPDNVIKRLSFMGSLADNVPSWRCHPLAIRYHDNYKSLREELTRKLFMDFNRNVFGDGLDADLPVVWDTKLRRTAGTTTNRLIKNSKGDRIRTSLIKLSSKVLDGPARLRDTLIHEMCHAATWLVDAELRAGHGPLWKKWAKRALQVYPELGEITRCHDLEIHFKYSYKCTKCGYSVQRHSKSIDITKKCCGYCRGTFEIVINKKNKDGVIVSTPARKGQTNEFAKYVKENYANEKDGRTHAQVMKILGEQFSAKKIKPT